MKKKSILTKSPNETIRLGKKIGKDLNPRDIVLLYGQLGTGKTLLIKGMCLGLGVKSEIKSPSFVIINEYQGILPIYHIDLYRVKPEEIFHLHLEEYFYNCGVTMVEWADRLKSSPIGTTMKIYLHHLDNQKRRITIYDLRD